MPSESSDVKTGSASGSSFGAAMLAKMGWSEGEGLGKERHGITAPLIVQKRESLAGIGTEKKSEWINWWEDLYDSCCPKTEKTVPEQSDEEKATAKRLKKEKKKEKKAKEATKAARKSAKNPSGEQKDC